jgi:hypothetical protein
MANTIFLGHLYLENINEKLSMLISGHARMQIPLQG